MTPSEEAKAYEEWSGYNKDPPEEPVKIDLCPRCGFDINVKMTCTCDWTEEMILDYERTKEKSDD